ncbi:cell envelope integrity protein TolA [Aquimarina gracilis]|uniref:Cell envelope integrity protein TolA n=1 Tax=Aquimarina gracilis TaxID=874422 RepID=A0ABU5ZUB7_9FLAO|nr:cell envelope integrity protein TolA [Aquimarina gracilis]MEB3344977.1 cell envelope integrity protein TolA [Aquimarina gracilis]
MLKLDTKHKRKSFVLTLLLHIGLIFLLFYLSLNYIVPEEESGIAVNFGTTSTGSGKVQPNKPIKTSPKNTAPEATPVTPEPQEDSPEIIEEVATQETEDAPVIDKKPKKKPQKKVEKPIKNPENTTDQKLVKNPVKDSPKKKVEEKKPDPKPDKSTLDILNSFSNGPKNDGKTNGGEGNDRSPGDKGSPDGDPNARSYYGTGKGLDGDGNYRLGGRKALNKEKFVQDCNESGIVVVKIEVNQSGRVVKATPGVKGTTNSASCLMEPAKRAALATRFNSDSKAPVKQVGTIIYQFKLSE